MTRPSLRGAALERGSVLWLAAWLASGCATTTVEFAGERPAAPVCQRADEHIAALVLWGPSWRADQKDVAAREQAAERGITQFFATPACFARTEVKRLATGVQGTRAQAEAAAAASGIDAGRVVYVVVRELGPVVKLLASAALIEGGTEVVLDVAAYDIGREQQARFTTHWRHGGGGVIKGVASLPEDMRSALAVALSGAGTAAQ